MLQVKVHFTTKVTAREVSRFPHPESKQWCMQLAARFRLLSGVESSHMRYSYRMMLKLSPVNRCNLMAWLSSDF